MNASFIEKFHRFFSQNYIIKAFTSFSAIQIIGILAGFIILSLFTKSLSPEDFGKVTFIMILVVILATIIDCGLNTAFSIRFYKVSDEENKKNIFTILIYNLLVLILFCIPFLLFPSFSQKLFKTKLSMYQQISIFFLILVTIVGRFYTNFLMIAKKPKTYFIVNVCFYFILIVMSLIFLLVLKTGYFSYVYAYIIAHSSLAITGLWYFLFRYRIELKKSLSFTNLISLLKLGLPLVPNSLILMLLTYADRYILGMYTGLAAVGIYSVGYTFSEKVQSAIISPVGQALTPIGFKTFAKDISEYKILLKKIFEGYWLLIGIFLVFYFSILRELFTLLIGKQYLEGYNIIPIVIIGTVFFGAANMVAGTVVMKEKTDKIFLFSLIAVVINILLNFILIPGFDIYGAAIATLISYVVYFCLFFRYTQQLVYVPYNFRLILSSGLIWLIFLGLIVSVSYLKINILISLLIKITLMCFSVLIMQKLFNVKDVIKQVLQYGR